VFNIRDMVFRVTPRLSYDAHREYRRDQKHLKARKENPSEKPMELEQQELQKKKEEVLKKRIEVGTENNNSTIAHFFGKKVTYGIELQLMHVDSGFYLQHAKRVSDLNKGCQLLELVPEPAPSRVTFVLQSRYKYRAYGEPVVFGDHILLYNQKYNQFLNCSEEVIIDQLSRVDLPSEHRPKSPLRKPSPISFFRRFEANMSQNFSKWQVINYRQIRHAAERRRFLFSGDVISLKHAETAGLMCHDDQSYKKRGEPVYVRIYKGNDAETENLTTHSLFEITIHKLDFQETYNQMGGCFRWEKGKKANQMTQIVRFRHVNSGKLLKVKPLFKDDAGGDANTKRNSQRTSRGTQRKSTRASGNSKADKIEKYILCLGDVMEPHEINRRIDRISEILHENKYEMDFNHLTHPEIVELNKTVPLDQVFEIENTIIEPSDRIKNQSVVKIRNLMYNMYLSTEIKRLDGDADELEDGDGGDDNLLINQDELGGGGFADGTDTRTAQNADAGESPMLNVDDVGGGEPNDLGATD